MMPSQDGNDDDDLPPTLQLTASLIGTQPQENIFIIEDTFDPDATPGTTQGMKQGMNIVTSTSVSATPPDSTSLRRKDNESFNDWKTRLQVSYFDHYATSIADNFTGHC